MTALLAALVVFAAPVEPTGKFKLEGEPLAALRVHAKRMVDTAQAGDAQGMVDLMYPGVIKGMGGPKKAHALVLESLADVKAGPSTLDRADIADPHFCTRVPAGIQCVLKQTNHLTFEGRKFFTVADVIAFSSDKGARWTFFSVSEHTLADLRKLMPEISADLPLVPRSRQSPRRSEVT